MKNILHLWILASMILLSACAHQAEKVVDKKAAAQGAVESPAEATRMGRQKILESNKLTDEQKMKLLDLFDKTDVQLAEIKEKQGPLKASLFQSLSEGQYDPKELTVYFQKIRKYENQKMDLMFSSLLEAGGILNKNRDPEIPLELMKYYGSALGN